MIVAIVFYKNELIKDETGLPEPYPKGKTYVKFHLIEAVEKHKDSFERMLKQ
ncbi:hypothetical protein [Emticicia sp. 17c]|uniref:hypothetical protein n=1 Tax=Emticicia sp. 17c TaxID=3127704 RepID=UPI00301C7214